MVKGATTTSGAGGIYSATYSNIPVYEFQFGADLKEHVMRRRSDDWINATHILKAVGFDKPARTRILERDVQKLPQFEKIQGGYGKYQGTWIPLASGAELAKRNNVYEKLRPIFEFSPSNISPPPAPKHTTNKPKAPKKPAVPKFNMSAPAPMRETSYDNISTQLNDDETPDDATVASQSFMGDPDDYNMPQSQQSTGQRKRKRNTENEMAASQHEQAHTLYADELLDYFMLSQERNGTNIPMPYPEPPLHFQPDWAIDTEKHTALSWACSMGDVEVMKTLLRFGANIRCQNIRDETPFMRSVFFVNCFEKKTFPVIVKALIGTVEMRDQCLSTVIHHAAALTHSKHKTHIARYYLEVILNELSEVCSPDDVQRLIDAQDMNGDTALHLVARNKAQKCVRSLLGRKASSDIPNSEGFIVDHWISRSREDRLPQASSSPFAPTHHRMDYPLPSSSAQVSRPPVSHHSEAAMTVEQKIAPTMMEKFRDLANSFDAELVDADTSEKSSRRILTKNQEEVQAIRDQIQELVRKEESQEPWNRAEQYEILAQEEATLMSLIEQQQQYKLHSLIQAEDPQAAATVPMNGNQTPEQALAEKNEIAMRLIQEMELRKALVKEYIEARGIEGAGENTEKYRRLVISSLKLDSKITRAELESSLDDFIEVYENDRADFGREVLSGGVNGMGRE